MILLETEVAKQKLYKILTTLEKDAAAALGRMVPERISLCLPVSEAHIARKLGLDRAGLLERLERCLELGKDLGFSYISVGLEDASRADRGFSLAVAERAQELGAARVRLSDTVGLLSPSETAGLVREFRGRLSIHLAVHCHDDFGLATANALAALEAGADYADATALGLGERAGLASLEQLAGFLTLRRGAGYDLRAMRAMCRMAAAGRGQEVHAPLLDRADRGGGDPQGRGDVVVDPVAAAGGREGEGGDGLVGDADVEHAAAAGDADRRSSSATDRQLRCDDLPLPGAGTQRRQGIAVLALTDYCRAASHSISASAARGRAYR